MDKNNLNDKLFKAIFEGDVEKVIESIKQGADVNAKYQQSINYIGRHNQSKVTDVLKMSNSEQADFLPVLKKFLNVIDATPLMFAVRWGFNNEMKLPKHGHLKILKILIDEGANVNASASSPKNLTALHLACLDPNATIIKCLLDNGANPNMKCDTHKPDVIFYIYYFGIHTFLDICEEDLYLQDKKITGQEILSIYSKGERL